MDYSDVIKKKSLYQSNRDPLNPVYFYTKGNGAISRYGEIEGNRPKVGIKDIGEMIN